jgi:hypothetical protein
MSKPWKTKEWEDKRKKLIQGKSCEWCGVKENLRIHHKKKIKNYNSHVRSIRNRVLKEKIRKGEFKTQKISVPTCPKCNTHRKSDIRPRKRAKPTYRCYNCGNEFETPNSRLEDTGRLSSSEWEKFIDKYQSKILQTVEKKRATFFKNYMNFKDVIILCSKCHFIFHNDGRILCKICKKNYHLKKYKQCFDCAVQTNPVLERYRRIEVERTRSSK